MNKRMAAEFLGTLWLMLGGCGSAVLAAAFPGVGIGLLGGALAGALFPEAGGMSPGLLTGTA